MAYIELLCALTAALLWYIWPSAGPWPLALLGMGIVSRHWTHGGLIRRTAFDWLLFLFVLSALVGAGVAYDRSAAWGRFWPVLGSLGIYGALVAAPDQTRLGRWTTFPLLRVTFVLLPVFVALYFLLTNDWAGRIGKLSWLDPLMQWFALQQAASVTNPPNSNVVGGLIATLLPLQVAALAGSGFRRRAWAAIPLLLLSAIVLVLSASRGAWVALALIVCVWGVWTWLRHITGDVGRQRRWLIVFAVIALAGVGFLALTPLGDAVLALRSDRWAVWRNSLDLVNDYTFTGLGLGSFEMAYSSYALLVHVGNTIHAHNLFLDLWLEQGLLGVLTFCGLSIVALVQRQQPASWYRTAALAALGVVVLHGMLDDAFYGYGGRAIPFLLVPFALLARPVTQPVTANEKAHKPSWFKRYPSPIWWGIGVDLFLLALLFPGLRAGLLANVGAVLQTRTELSVYRWPEWPIQDSVRRSSQVDLYPAITYYQEALQLDPLNATAQRRLGQIELSQGNYDSACQHLRRAYAVAPQQRATRQLLGECYAINGDSAAAASLWRSIDLSPRDLEGRRWWYVEGLMDRTRAKHMMRAIEALAALTNKD